jgi:hypothetical protein
VNFDRRSSPWFWVGSIQCREDELHSQNLMPRGLRLPIIFITFVVINIFNNISNNISISISITIFITEELR